MEQKNQHNGGFGNGFVLGLLIGVVGTLLVTTKRGRELVKEFTEKGMDKFSDFETKIKETTENVVRAEEDFEEVDDESEYVEPQKRPAPVRLSEERSERKEPEQKSSKVRRFFTKKK